MGGFGNFVDQAGVTRLRASGGGGGSVPDTSFEIENGGNGANLFLAASFAVGSGVLVEYASGTLIEDAADGTTFDAILFRTNGAVDKELLSGANGCVFWLVNLDAPATKAYVRLTADTTFAPGDRITFDHVLYDPDSCFDAAGHRFVIPAGKAGLYLVGLAVICFDPT